MVTSQIAFTEFCSVIRRKGASAICLLLCTLGLGLPTNAQEHAKDQNSDDTRAKLISLNQISVDTSGNPGTDTTVQHKTEVDPSQATFGNMIVTTFQNGEIADWNGASQVGWSTSLDGGQTWRHGYIPGTTSYYWVQVVYFDLKHNTWLIIMVAQDMNPQDSNYLNPTEMQVSRSLDGIHWSTPIPVYGPISYNGWVNRPWVACDNNVFSHHFGNCYIAWDDANFDTGVGTNDVSVSSDGGLTWSAPTVSPDQCAGSIGGVAIQPNGNLFLIGAYDGGCTEPQVYLYSIESTDGGQTLQQTVDITAEQLAYPVEGGVMRQDPFPSTAVSLDGRINVVTYDCRFRPNCATNDIVMTTSKDGVNWSPIERVPIDPLDSGADHFVAGIGAPRFLDIILGAAPGALAVNYYYVPDAATCDPTSAAGCQLYAGFISSQDGGKTWSNPTRVFGPMNIVKDLAQTAFGYFVANDITAIYVNGHPQAVYSLALPPNPKMGTLNQAIYSARFTQ